MKLIDWKSKIYNGIEVEVYNRFYSQVSEQVYENWHKIMVGMGKQIKKQVNNQIKNHGWWRVGRPVNDVVRLEVYNLVSEQINNEVN
jgi:hypothetical protein